MSIELRKIDVQNYDLERERMLSLAQQIWTRSESLENVKESIEHWGTNKDETGTYLYITQNNQLIGLTGYYVIDEGQGLIGLRHHGTTIKGTGREALDALVDYLHQVNPHFSQIVELIPAGKEDLITVFEGWGFQLWETDMWWERKKDYYKYAMKRDI